MIKYLQETVFAWSYGVQIESFKQKKNENLVTLFLDCMFQKGLWLISVIMRIFYCLNHYHQM